MPSGNITSISLIPPSSKLFVSLVVLRNSECEPEPRYHWIFEIQLPNSSTTSRNFSKHIFKRNYSFAIGIIRRYETGKTCSYRIYIVLETSWNFLKLLETPWNFSKLLETSQNFQNFSKVLEGSRNFTWNFLKFVKHIGNFSKLLETVDSYCF